MSTARFESSAHKFEQQRTCNKAMLKETMQTTRLPFQKERLINRAELFPHKVRRTVYTVLKKCRESGLRKRAASFRRRNRTSEGRPESPYEKAQRSSILHRFYTTIIRNMSSKPKVEEGEKTALTSFSAGGYWL